MSLCVASGLADRSFFPDASSLTKLGVELEQPTKSVAQRIGITRRMVPPLRVGSFGEIALGNCPNQGCRRTVCRNVAASFCRGERVLEDVVEVTNSSPKH